MNIAKWLWKSLHGDPVFMRKINGWLTVIWLVMIPVSFSFHWLSSVTYVSALGLWSIVTGHWSTWQAARVEVKQEIEANKRLNEDIPKETAIEVVKTLRKKR